MRDTFNKILMNHGVFGEDAERVLCAVHDMLIYAAEKTKQEEPHAINSIRRLEKAAYEVGNLAYNL